MELTKNKKRAARRKRNFIAKSLIEDKQFRPKVIGPKKKRHKLNVKDVLDELIEESESGTEQVQDRVQEKPDIEGWSTTDGIPSTGQFPDTSIKGPSKSD